MWVRISASRDLWKIFDEHFRKSVQMFKKIFPLNVKNKNMERKTLNMKSSFPKRDKCQIEKNEFVMPFFCVLNLFTAPSMFHAKSLNFLV